MLEIFEGSKHAIDAPEWTQWTRPTLQFQQPRASFAALFGRMALWDVNRDDVSSSHVVGLWILGLSLFNLASSIVSNDPVGTLHLG